MNGEYVTTFTKLTAEACLGRTFLEYSQLLFVLMLRSIDDTVPPSVPVQYSQVTYEQYQV